MFFIGTNPWQSHGFPEARKQLQALQKDPARTLIVVDLIRTETARMADIHLQIRPSTDACLMAAIMLIWIEEGLVDQEFIAAHTTGLDAAQRALQALSVQQLVQRTGLEIEQVRDVLPQDILAERDDRVRALVVDSANPMRSGADTPAYAEAFAHLELLVVIDVAMTETARQAHYVLPASSHYEKWEATFFNLGFPKNHFQLRRPIAKPLPGSLPEPEIYRRLLVAMGVIPARFPLLERVARLDRKQPKLRLFPLAFAALLKAKPKLAPYAVNILYATLGRALASDTALPDGSEAAAVLWAAAGMYAKKHQAAVERTGLKAEGAGLGEALFSSMLSGAGVELSHHAYSDSLRWLRHPDQRVHLAIPELLSQLTQLSDARRAQTVDLNYPLSAAA